MFVATPVDGSIVSRRPGPPVFKTSVPLRSNARPVRLVPTIRLDAIEFDLGTDRSEADQIVGFGIEKILTAEFHPSKQCAIGTKRDVRDSDSRCSKVLEGLGLHVERVKIADERAAIGW